MKITHLFFLLIVILASCKDDDPALPDGASLLKYDGANNSGPLLEAGKHELAVRFPASTMADLAGKKLTEVQVFVGDVLPKDCAIKLYRPGNATSPGALFYEGNVLSTLRTLQWNNFKITPAIDITGEDLWVSVYVEHGSKQQSIGCDAGPRKTNGDWLLSDSDHDWLTYEERTGESVNWNIRALVE